MTGFLELRRELDRWADEGRTVALWWRDDDAVRPTEALGRLLALGKAHRAPLGLAVIPAGADASLAPVLEEAEVEVLQHGYAHRNHAAAGGRALECGGNRTVDAVLTELDAGRRRLQAVFPNCFLPVMVPPWSRIDADVRSRLRRAGYRALSCFGADDPPARPRDGLVELNAHLDILTWRAGARFAGHGKLVRLAAERLAARRLSARRHVEPFGLLTHHLDHDEASWEFLRGLLPLLGGHEAVRWHRPSQLVTTLETAAARDEVS